MSSKNGTVARHFLITLGIMLAMATVILGGSISTAAFADDGDLAAVKTPPPARTIMIYMDGAASEENKPVCSAMLKEYMESKFDRSSFRIIVMTGGSLK